MSGKVLSRDADAPASVPEAPRASRWKHWLTPAIILLMAAGIVVLITGNWNRWTGERASQETDDAYLRADLTPLSTKAAGLVATVAVSDYQAVKAGDLLVQLRDDDFRAQVQQAEAAVSSGRDALIHNQRQKELQDARIVQAEQGIHAAEAEIAAAEAGVEAAKSAIGNAQKRHRRSQSGRGAYRIGAAAAGSAGGGGIRDAPEAGAGGSGRAALSCPAGEPPG